MAAPNDSANFAISSLTPSNSNKILPGLILDTQYSTDPFPLPILTSAGFLETGTSELANEMWNAKFTEALIEIDQLKSHKNALEKSLKEDKAKLVSELQKTKTYIICRSCDNMYKTCKRHFLANSHNRIPRRMWTCLA